MTNVQRLFEEMLVTISKIILIRMIMYNEDYDTAKIKAAEVVELASGR